MAVCRSSESPQTGQHRVGAGGSLAKTQRREPGVLLPATTPAPGRRRLLLGVAVLQHTVPGRGCSCGFLAGTDGLRAPVPREVGVPCGDSVPWPGALGGWVTRQGTSICAGAGSQQPRTPLTKAAGSLPARAGCRGLCWARFWV